MESCKTCFYDCLNEEKCSHVLMHGTDICSDHTSFLEMNEERVEESKLTYPYVWGD